MSWLKALGHVALAVGHVAFSGENNEEAEDERGSGDRNDRGDRPNYSGAQRSVSRKRERVDACCTSRAMPVVRRKRHN